MSSGHLSSTLGDGQGRSFLLLNSDAWAMRLGDSLKGYWSHLCIDWIGLDRVFHNLEGFGSIPLNST